MKTLKKFKAGLCILTRLHYVDLKDRQSSNGEGKYVADCLFLTFEMPVNVTRVHLGQLGQFKRCPLIRVIVLIVLLLVFFTFSTFSSIKALAVWALIF